MELLAKKNVIKLSGSEIKDPKKPIPDHGSRGQKGTGSQNWIRNTGKNVTNRKNWEQTQQDKGKNILDSSDYNNGTIVFIKLRLG
jgi:hypothetical protein